MTFSRTSLPRLSTTAGLAAALLASPAFAEEVLAEDVAGANVSGVVGVDLYSHFVSYGIDVWGEGDAFSGSETFNPYAEVALDFGSFSVATGLWGDLNDNAASGLGGDIQEVDWYLGLSTSVDKFSLGVVYQAWMYGGGTEEILDFNIGYDDSELWGDSGFSLSPSVTIHNRIGSSLGQEEGTIVVVGGEAPIDLGESALSLSVPVSVGIVLDDDYFIAGGDTGIGYYSVGLSAGYGLGEVIGAEYGDWSLNAGVTLYSTESDIYANPEDTFLVYNVGVSMAF